MPDFNYKEIKLEEAIESYLINHGGYIKGDSKDFDPVDALDKKTLIAFIKDTQPKLWKRYEAIYGASSEQSFINRFSKEVRQVGLLSILRKGFKDRGVHFKVVYFKPETTINMDTALLYEKNIMHCTRQLYYSTKNKNSIDMVLFVNGIPVVTMELKNQLTGQYVYHAMEQYRKDRSPNEAIFAFKQRSLVNFCVDLSEVRMTTRLLGDSTFFLPFNQGSNGAGNVGGAGNPIRKENYDSAYLWENVLVKDRLLEILHKYMHYDKQVDKNGIVKETMIFPRYHQLDVVTKLLGDVKQNGAGKNYLIQHSAGSGKSNSIAWLAHRLSGLHDTDNNKIFKSIIVITDRKVLDSQLQDTIYQFDHVAGVVEKIDKNSSQLKDAINDGRAIIITTLQKFPVIYNEVSAGNGNFAVIVDEAHSSQTGESAKKLKKALANTEAVLEEYASFEGEEEGKRLDYEDRLVKELASHGRHENLSFFAFTATPKSKTLQMFGERQEDGSYRAYHIYSMRQAVEENFIHDVLKNYTTYSMYYKIIKDIPDDPELDSAAGIRALRRFESLHPHNLAQKTAIMVEHFREKTKHQINGKAKAMVVTASRLHAVRYLFEFRRYIESKGYEGLDVLVAFSGEVEDEGASYTEEKLNKDKGGETIKESQLKENFHSDDFNMLIVAEKYQTGFDEPYLHTMFVDKKLSGVKAVQTLSRLNRTTGGKKSTFVLDFVNTAEEIKEAFQPYYEATVLEEETDPNVIYNLKNALDEYQIYNSHEVMSFGKLFFSNEIQGDNDTGKLSSFITPAIDRFKDKTDEEKDEFRSTLSSFNRIYAFIAQVCRMFDEEIHIFSVYARFLHRYLPHGESVKVNIEEKVLLDYYRVEKDFEGSIILESEDNPLQPIAGGAGSSQENKDSLAELIDKVNERFGTEFTEVDKVMHQVKNDFLADDFTKEYVKSNNSSMFDHIYYDKFKELFIKRYQQNDQFSKQLISDEAMMSFVMESMKNEIFTALKKAQ